MVVSTHLENIRQKFTLMYHNQKHQDPLKYYWLGNRDSLYGAISQQNPLFCASLLPEGILTWNRDSEVLEHEHHKPIVVGLGLMVYMIFLSASRWQIHQTFTVEVQPKDWGQILDAAWMLSSNIKTHLFETLDAVDHGPFKIKTIKHVFSIT